MEKPVRTEPDLSGYFQSAAALAQRWIDGKEQIDRGAYSGGFRRRLARDPGQTVIVRFQESIGSCGHLSDQNGQFVEGEIGAFHHALCPSRGTRSNLRVEGKIAQELIEYQQVMGALSLRLGRMDDRLVGWNEFPSHFSQRMRAKEEI